jgi:hypothetical protein
MELREEEMALAEKLGDFYLGKEYDPVKRKLAEELLYFDARNLTTHAVCIGMTGSGKTGLGISILEDAAIDKVPAIIIDPKGDLTNLLLTFPELRPEDFEPWVNPDDAARKGMSTGQYAAKTAETWRTGLASWEQEPERISLLMESADFTIYTPGSDAGIPVSIVGSFQAPHINADDDAEGFNEHVGSTVSALLGLLGIEADPVRSREYILVANILDSHWRKGENLTIQEVIKGIQKPPFGQVGVVDLESFYPEKERFALAMLLNNLIASPSFAIWLKGEPINISKMLYTDHGEPRHSIFYIAHLSDQERMFIVTLLLGEIVSWMRAQSGTTSLRALLYMDEVFGYLPPSREPPSKRQFLTLLKQGRAFGLGLILCTQNPVDLDYKALSNAGTWFIGKLQTERDKQRLMEGLQSIGAQTGPLADPRLLDKLISSLESRVFLLHCVHEDEPVVYQTRWVMSYLAGPLTRPQVRRLMADKRGEAPASVAKPAASAAPVREQSASSTTVTDGLMTEAPASPPGIPLVYLPVELSESDAVDALRKQMSGAVTPQAARLVYEPAVLGAATVRFRDAAKGIDEERDFNLLVPIAGKAELLSWKNAEFVDVDPARLPDEGEPGALHYVGPGSAPDPKKAITTLRQDLDDHLYGTATHEVDYHKGLKLYAESGESASEFAARVMQVAKEARDGELDVVYAKYQKKMDDLNKRLEKEQQELEADRADYTGRLAEEALTGATMVASFFGLGRRRTLSSMATRRRMSATAKADIAESEQAIARMQSDMTALEAAYREEAAAVVAKWEAASGDLDRLKLTPRRSDVDVNLVALAWAPHWWIDYRDARGRSQTGNIPAYPVVEG